MDQNKLTKLLKAVANKRRVQIILYLKKHKILNVSGIAEKLTLSYRATSKHLRKMEAAGVLESHQSSNLVFYKISEDVPVELIGLFARIGL